jgi:hypothetical protein
MAAARNSSALLGEADASINRIDRYPAQERIVW